MDPIYQSDPQIVKELELASLLDSTNDETTVQCSQLSPGKAGVTEIKVSPFDKFQKKFPYYSNLDSVREESKESEVTLSK